jgi:hypothetical protein
MTDEDITIEVYDDVPVIINRENTITSVDNNGIQVVITDSYDYTNPSSGAYTYTYLNLDQTTPQTMTGLDDGFLKLTGGEIGTGEIDLSGYVPYTGATTDVNLGNHNLTIGDGTIGASVQFTVNGDGTADKKISFKRNGTEEAYINVDSGEDLIIANIRSNEPILFKTHNGTAVGTRLTIESNGNLVSTGNITGSNLSGTNTGDQDLSSYALISNVLALDQTTPQTLTASPYITALTASLGVYTNANKQLTSTVPTSGILGYWSRTSPILTPANANDRVNVTVAATTEAGVPYCYNGTATVTGSSETTSGFYTYAARFDTFSTFALTGTDVFTFATLNNYGTQNSCTVNAAHTRTLGEEGSANEANVAMANTCYRGSGNPATSAVITIPTFGISNFAIANTCANYSRYNCVGGTLTTYNYGGHFTLYSVPTLIAGTIYNYNYGFYATIISGSVGSTTNYGAYISVQGTGNTNWGFYNASTAASLAHNSFGVAGINSGFGLVSAGTIPTAKVHIGVGTSTAGTAPIKLTAGVVTTTAVAGQIEFATGNNDNLTFCITSGPARKNIVLADGTLTTGKYPKTSTNGRLIDGPTPLAGTKVYYVSDSSGGTVNRKLTFTDGILTAET